MILKSPYSYNNKPIVTVADMRPDRFGGSPSDQHTALMYLVSHVVTNVSTNTFDASFRKPYKNKLTSSSLICLIAFFELRFIAWNSCVVMRSVTFVMSLENIWMGKPHLWDLLELSWEGKKVLRLNLSWNSKDKLRQRSY